MCVYVPVCEGSAYTWVRVSQREEERGRGMGKKKSQVQGESCLCLGQHHPSAAAVCRAFSEGSL